MRKRVLSVLLVFALAVGAMSMSAMAAGESQAYEVGYSKVDINPYWHEWVEWSQTTTNEIPDALRGVIPYESFYDEYDLMPLPMAGYGGNEKRLSRPKLVDDNGSGVGASSTSVTNSSYYYLKSDGSYAKASNTGHYTALYSRTYKFGTGWVYTQNTNYQDVHLSSNRYTKELAAEMGVTYSDGVYGENDGDGVWATCVLVKDPQSSSPVLMITVDNIGVTEGLVDLIKESVVKASAIKALGLTEDRILITSNHTHGSVSLGTTYSSTDTTTTYTLAEGKIPDEKSYTFTAQQMYWYLNFYKNLLIDQLTKAAVTAAGDLETALTMEKGTIDASDATGYQLNGVRHSVQTYTPSDGSKSAITYVRGSSFNNDMNQDGNSDTHAGSSVFSKSQPVSESDDSLHILQFTFANKKPIAMVNFRAHSTANNKQAALLLHYNISSDWVAPLRYEMEQAGYRFSLLYGSSGNLGTGNSNGDGEAIVSSYANYNSSTKRWELPATPHGRQVAAAALKLLENDNTNNAIKLPMTSVNMGKIESLRSNYVLQKQEWSPLAYAAALSYYNAGSPTYGGRYTIADGETVTYGSASITLGAGQGGTFVIASQYHASRIKSQYTATHSVALELNALVMGESVAFATTSVEASDRYSNKEITGDENIIGSDGNSNYNENDWDNLINEDAWGTPFVLSLTNASNGYVPNQLAYDYGKDYTGTDYIVARGSYESNNTYANRGEGEKMVASLNTLLRSVAKGVESTRTAYCEYCKAEKTWKMFDKSDISSSNSTIAAGHYFLASDFDHAGYTKIVAGETVCLDLNGHAFSAKAYATSSRACNLSGRLNVHDTSEEQTGKIQGCGVKWTTSTGFGAGTIMVSSGAELNLYSGSITMLHWEGYGPYNGGVLSVTGTFNMYGGKVYGGIANNGLTDATSCNGGNILVSSSAGVFNMYGGEICDGEAYNNGGNIYMSAGKVNLLGGTITGGKAAEGAGIYAAGGTLTINGTDILGGEASGNGGSLYVAGGTVKLTNGTVGGGKAVNGGGVYLAKAMTMTAGMISAGEAENGGALYVASGVTQTLNKVNLSGGKAVNGGTVYLPSGATLTTTATTQISGGEAESGGAVYLAGGTLKLVSGATIIGGEAENGGCVYLPAASSLSVVTGCQIESGNATNGGCVYMEEGAALTLASGAAIYDGSAENGGNVYLAGSTLNLTSNTPVLGGKAVNGGNVYVAGGTLKLASGAPVSEGTATNGGNVYLAGGVLNMMNGTTLSGGSAENGGNVYLAGGALNMVSTAAITDGEATNGGNLYVAGETAYTWSVGTVSGGSATNGGNLYIPANAEFTLTGGTIADGTATSGGGIYVAANGKFTISGGTVTGGTVTGNGGNVHVASKATMVMTDGQISQGRAEKGTSSTMGGNIYNAGTFTMSGGTIRGGYAYFGGNVQAQGATAYFTMKGGLIEGGSAGYNANVADLCTGQPSAGDGFSTFRMEGGYIAGRAYIQGLVILTGTTDGDVPVNFSVKAANERLTIEGKYTGKVNITFNGSTFNVGDKVGNAVDADLSEATILFAGMTGKCLSVVNDELRLSIRGVVKIGDVGYDTIEEALEAYTGSAALALLSDLDLGALTKDLTLDLNGFAVRSVDTNGYKLYCMDSATDDFDVADGIYGKVPADAGVLAADGYLAVMEDEQTSFHKYEMNVTHLVVNTNKVGMTYKSAFHGDQVVKAQVKEFGLAVRAYNIPNEDDILQDAGGISHVALQQQDWQTGNDGNALKSVYIVGILGEGETAERNNLRAEIQVYGVCYMLLNDGTMLMSDAQAQSLKSALEYMCSEGIWEQHLTDTDRQDLAAFYQAWEAVMQDWTGIDRIKELASL